MNSLQRGKENLNNPYGLPPLGRWGPRVVFTEKRVRTLSEGRRSLKGGLTGMWRPKRDVFGGRGDAERGTTVGLAV